MNPSSLSVLILYLLKPHSHWMEAIDCIFSRAGILKKAKKKFSIKAASFFMEDKLD